MGFYSLTAGLKGEADVLDKFHNWIKGETRNFKGFGESTIIEYLESNGQKDGAYEYYNEVKISQNEIKIIQLHDEPVADFQSLFSMMCKTYSDIDFFVFGEIDDDSCRGYSCWIYENGKKTFNETFEYFHGHFSDFFKDTCGAWLSEYYTFWEKLKRGQTSKNIISNSNSSDKLLKAALQLEKARVKFDFIDKVSGLMEKCLGNLKIDFSANCIEEYLDEDDLKELKMDHSAFIDKMLEVFKEFNEYDNSILKTERIDLSGNKLSSFPDLSFFTNLKEINLTETGFNEIPIELDKKIKDGVLQVIGIEEENNGGEDMKKTEAGNFNIHLSLYAIGDEEKVENFKKDLKKIIDDGEIILSSYDLDYSPFVMFFQINNCNYNPENEGEIVKNFLPLMHEYSDGSEDCVTFCYVIDEFTDSEKSGFGCAYEAYDLDCDLSFSDYKFYQSSDFTYFGDPLKEAQKEKALASMEKNILKWITESYPYISESSQEKIQELLQDGLPKHTFSKSSNSDICDDSYDGSDDDNDNDDGGEEHEASEEIKKTFFGTWVKPDGAIVSFSEKNYEYQTLEEHYKRSVLKWITSKSDDSKKFEYPTKVELNCGVGTQVIKGDVNVGELPFYVEYYINEEKAVICDEDSNILKKQEGKPAPTPTAKEPPSPPPVKPAPQPVNKEAPPPVQEATGAVCPKCGKVARVGAKFCSACGTKFDPVCANCGRQLKATSKFCPGCGTKVEQ